MANETVKLKLDGEVSLRDFYTATQALLNLLDEFTAEASSDSAIDWIVTDLEDGSALIECTGIAETEDAASVREFVVVAYDGLATDMALGTLDDYSPRIRNSARELSSVINGRIPRILMSTGDDEPKSISVHIEPEELEPEENIAAPAPDIQFKKFLRTTVKGEVVLASKAKRHYFTLKQAHTGHQLRCYAKPDLWHIAYDCLGKANQFVLVEGMFNTDRKVMTDIKAIVPMPPSSQGGWRLAIGSAPAPDGSISTHDAIRKVRDGDE